MMVLIENNVLTTMELSDLGVEGTTVWFVVIAFILLLILGALRRGNLLKAVQIEAEQERHEAAVLDAEEQRGYDVFFSINHYPHRHDVERIAVWAAERGWTSEQAREFLLDAEIHEDISRSLDDSKRQRLLDIQKHGWQAKYVALAFTAEQRSGEEFRPIHGLIWKPTGEKYYLNLVNLSQFAKSGCDSSFPLQERSVAEGTFTVEKAQSYEWDDIRNELYLADIG